MGWTTMYREKGLSNDEFFRREFPTTLTERGTILDSATIGGVYYAAVKGSHNSPDEVWCLVVLTARYPRAADGLNFGYKEMSDTMGPAEDRCPLRIIDLLTPTDSEWSNEWRARCRAYAAKPKPKKGDVVEFERPIAFSNGVTLARFRYAGRGNAFVSEHDSVERPECRYSIGGWRDRAFTLVEAA